MRERRCKESTWGDIISWFAPLNACAVVLSPAAEGDTRVGGARQREHRCQFFFTINSYSCIIKWDSLIWRNEPIRINSKR